MKRIRKVSQSIPIKAKVVNSYSESEEETYSCDYVNEHKQDKLIAGTGIEITGENIINNIQGNYSTSETKIGTWIDGKPLYSKTLSLTTPSTTNSTKIADFDKTFIIKKYYGNALIAASNQLLPINFYFTNEYNIATYVVNNSGEIYMKIGSKAYRNQQVTLTIEYTKTTD